MKRIALILTLCAIVCSGCWKDTITWSKSEQILNSWEYSTKGILEETVNVAFLSNAWINGNDSVRRVIEDNYFPTSRIRHEGGNDYGIYNGTQLVMLINTGGKTIDAVDADWLVTRYEYYQTFFDVRPEFFSSQGHTRLNIRSLGNNEWSVALDSLTCLGSTSYLTLSVPGDEVPVSLFSKPFTLSGGGTLVFSGSAFNNGNFVQSPVTMLYTLSTPMQQKVGNVNTFDNGVVDIVVSKAGEEDRVLHAELQNGNWNILYQGTETMIIEH